MSISDKPRELAEITRGAFSLAGNAQALNDRLVERTDQVKSAVLALEKQNTKIADLGQTVLTLQSDLDDAHSEICTLRGRVSSQKNSIATISDELTEEKTTALTAKRETEDLKREATDHKSLLERESKRQLEQAIDSAKTDAIAPLSTALAETADLTIRLKQKTDEAASATARAIKAEGELDSTVTHIRDLEAQLNNFDLSKITKAHQDIRNAMGPDERSTELTTRFEALMRQEA